MPRAQLERLAAGELNRDCYPLAMGFYPEASGHEVHREHHNDHLLIYCEAGAGHLSMAAGNRQVRPGDVVCLRSGVGHEYRADKQNPWTIYWFHFAGSLSNALIDRAGFEGQECLLHHGPDPQLSADFKRLMSLRRFSARLTALELASSLIKQILQHIALQQRLAEQERSRSFDVEAIQALMRSRLHEQVSLNSLADAANLSRYHFSDKYRKLTGHPPLQHFIQMKMERACQMLDTSDAAIKSVAASLGYRDPLYFSRVFQNTMGMSPTAYRQQRSA